MLKQGTHTRCSRSFSLYSVLLEAGGMLPVWALVAADADAALFPLLTTNFLPVASVPDSVCDLQTT